MKPKRYLLFEIMQFYPAGGWHDLLGSYDTPAEAELAWISGDRKWESWQLIDLETGEEVNFPEPLPWWDKK